jgi:hypothetical protein
MAHQPPHAFGVDNTACSFHSHKNTPSAWMMAPDLAPVSSPVLSVGHFRRALLVYSCQAPKRWPVEACGALLKPEALDSYKIIYNSS